MKKRILHVSYGGLSHGGVSSVIFSIVEPLKDRFDFDCVVFNNRGDEEERFAKVGKLHRVPCYRTNGTRSILENLTRPVRMIWGIYRICKKEKYDVIHVHNMGEAGFCLLGAHLAGVKVRIAHSHNTNTPQRSSRIKQLLGRWNNQLLKNHLTTQIACSRQAGLDFFHNDNSIVVENAVNLDKYLMLHRHDHPNIIFSHVGRYCYQKNQEFVIEVFAEIHKLMPNSELKLVGFGEEGNKLQKKIADSGLELYAELIPGDKVDVASIYAETDYLIFPSRFEGFGIVLIEAQAAGCKCFVSEAVQPEADAGGLIFLPLEKGAKYWAEQIVEEIKNAQNGGVHATKINVERYSQERVAEKYAEIYNQS